MFLSIQALAICQINNTIGEYISWENISRGLTFAKKKKKIANLMEGIMWIQIRNLISQKLFLWYKTKGLILLLF